MRPLLDRMEVLDPISAHQIRGELAVRDGDLVGFTRHLLASLDIEPDAAPNTAGGLVWVFGALRLPAEVHNAAQLTSEPVHEALVLLSLGEPRAAVPLIRAEISEEQWAYNCWLGDVLYQLGEFRDADEAFRKCWEQGWPMLGDGGVRLLMAADSARRVGDLERSATYERWFESVLQQATAAGEVPDKFLMAFYHAYHGRTEEATRDLIAGEPWGEWQGFQSSMPMFVELIQRPDYRAASARREELRQRQRVEVIEMLCGPEPASRKYRPRPETCALRKNPG